MFFKTKPLSKMRNRDVGDWDDEGNITVAETGKDDMNFLIAIHEVIEWYFCKRRGITDATVSEWDRTHKKMGDDVDAPYRWQHFFAESIERVLASAMMIEWSEYERALDNIE